MTLHRSFMLASCLAVQACGDDDANVRTDEALCGEERDPSNFYCDPDEELIDSTRAIALLREAYPGALIYSMESGWGGRTLNVDGEDYGWDFRLTDDDGTWRAITVMANGDFDGDEIDDVSCGGVPFEPLDSRRAVHQAVAAFEARVGPYVHGTLVLTQQVCGFEWLPETHNVELSPSHTDASLGDYYARFRHDGSFIDLVGPCQTSLEECLAGVVVEPEE